MQQILLIDDDPTIQMVFSRFLSNSGFEVIQAENGLKGIELLKAHDPDLVITDILMPEMDGLEMLMELRNSHPGMPVITMSGGLRNEPGSVHERAQIYGATRVLEKPVSLNILLSTVHELLKQQILKKTEPSS